MGAVGISPALTQTTARARSFHGPTGHITSGGAVTGARAAWAGRSALPLVQSHILTLSSLVTALRYSWVIGCQVRAVLRARRLSRALRGRLPPAISRSSPRRRVLVIDVVV